MIVSLFHVILMINSFICKMLFHTPKRLGVGFGDSFCRTV